MSFEQPVLCLGLGGFSRAQRERVTALLDRLPQGSPTWRVGPFAEADAWLVSGEKSRLLHAGTVKILAGQPTERAMQLNLSEVDRPIAFSMPLASSDFEPACTFSLDSDTDVHQVLQQFEGWLRPLRCQFVLGGQLIERESQLQPGIYHVSHKGVLLAVMDFYEWRIGIAPGVDPVDFELARWEGRPRSGSDMPAHFQPSSLAQLRWVYAQRTARDVLPPRYRTRPVYFRRAPGVPMRWLKDSQLVLLRELSVQAADFDALRRRTGLAPAQLGRDLASLYFAGSVTTTADKAGTGGFAARQETGPARVTDGFAGIFAREAEADAVKPRPRVTVDLTAPVQLGLK
jgi:hypothetical protein